MCPEALSSAAKPKRAKRKRPEADLMRHRGGHCFKRPRRAVEEEWDEELPFVVKRRSRRPNPPTHRAPNLCPEALSPVAKPRRSKRKRLEADLKRHGGGERSKRPRRMGTEEKLPIVVKWRTREEKESAGGVPEAEEEKKVEIGQQVASESQPAPDDEKGQHPKEYSYILYLEKEEEEHMRVQKEYIMDLEKEEEEHKRVQKVIYSSAYEEVASNKSGSMPKELCENVMGKLDKQEYIMDLEKEEEEHKRVQKVIYSSAYEEVASNKSSSMPKELFENVMGKLDKQEYIMALEKEEEEHKRVQKIKDSSAYMAVASNRFGSMPKELFENMEEKVDKQHPTQIFVDIFGSHVSMQEDLGKVSVKSLIQTAFRRVGVNTNNFYSTCSGKYLDEDRILSHCQILKDSTIKVHHRLRAGRIQTFDLQSWDQFIAGKPRYHVVTLPTDLIDTQKNETSATFLSSFIQCSAREVLIAMCRVHFRGFSLNGKFNSSHLLFNTGKVTFDTDIAEVPFDIHSCKRDYAVIHDIFHPVFWDEENNFCPLHAEHLLHFLFTCPAGARSNSEGVIAYLTNYMALKSFMERISICTNLDGMIHRLIGQQELDFTTQVAHPYWFEQMEDVPAMWKVLSYNAGYDATGYIYNYEESVGQLMHFAKNFFTHAPNNLRMEEIEAAFSLATSESNMLPNLLQQVACQFINPPPPADFCLVKLLGDNMALLDEEEH